MKRLIISVLALAAIASAYASYGAKVTTSTKSLADSRAAAIEKAVN